MPNVAIFHEMLGATVCTPHLKKKKNISAVNPQCVGLGLALKFEGTHLQNASELSS